MKKLFMILISMVLKVIIQVILNDWKFNVLMFLVSDVKLNLEKMMKQKEKAVSGLTGGVAYLLKKYGVTSTHGFGKITGPNEVQVTSDDGNTSTIKTKNILIATGSDVASLPGLNVRYY